MAAARDGSPVELYLRLPPRGEAELVHDAIGDDVEILELGCGVGPTERASFLAACARHVAADGVVLIERHEPDWNPSEGSGGRLGDLSIWLEDVRQEGGTVSATVRYEGGDEVWSHPFTANVLDDAELNASLGEVGLKLDAVLDDAGRWVAATPILRDIVAA